MRPSIYQQIIEKHPESYTAQIITLDAHCSNLQARLLATLDTLDELQRTHELEIEDLNRHVNTLQARTRVLKSRTKAAEAERDTLKEGVNKLIAKVEYANDHRVLPRARIYLPHLLESSRVIVEDPPETSSTANGTDFVLRSLLSSLSVQLRTARDAFNDLKRVSDTRITILEAQVARRDAEIEAYRPCPCSCHPHGLPEIAGHNSVHNDGTIRLPAPFPKNEALKTLEETTLRQQDLKVEVEGLSRKLAAARSAPTHVSATQNTTPSPKHQNGVNSADDKRATDLSPSTPRIATTAPKQQPILSALERQLDQLAQETEEFQTERENLQTLFDVDGNNIVNNERTSEEFRGILLIEEECIRLRKNERALRQQLLLATISEKDLRTQVERLQHQLNGISGSTSPKMQQDSPSTEGEADMELEVDVPNPVIEDETITARRSDLRSDTPSSIRPLDSPLRLSTPRPSNNRLAHIESELQAAREDVENKERAIETLRGQLAALQDLMRNHGLPTASPGVPPSASDKG
ncbi:hypothetical protein M422DRAFT_65303 [Sphaerobolus stellatus SS14]|nr:hypothetical protein M422DRAFT_65303 [Sphaerobolus stellatus SS14]